mmetsp:Transcript_24495/g.59434  ORF Transcript_24495/g.59434 Transcript_24495/m.59434 type:complete len:201 (+) Transcript_24495:2823-3425(+)
MFVNCDIREQWIVLGAEAQALPHSSDIVEHREASNSGIPCRHPHTACKALDSSRFTRSVVAQQRKDLSLRNVKRQSIHCVEGVLLSTSEGLHHVGNGQHDFRIRTNFRRGLRNSVEQSLPAKGSNLASQRDEQPEQRLQRQQQEKPTSGRHCNPSFCVPVRNLVNTFKESISPTPPTARHNLHLRRKRRALQGHHTLQQV